MNDFIMLFKGRNRYDRFEVVFCGLLFFIGSNPYFVWNTIFNTLCILLLLIILLRHLKFNLSRASLTFFILFFSFYLYFCLRSQQLNVLGKIAIFFPSIIFLTKDLYVIKLFNAYKLFFSITIIPSIIIFVLTQSFPNINIPYSEVSLSSERPLYYIYPFLVTNSLNLDFSSRFMGLYEEPGVIGTVAATLLFADKYNFKNKINIPIFVGGILSFSLFFYLVSLVLIFYFSIKKYPILLISLSFFLITFMASNELFNKFIYSRLTDDSDITNVVNRTSSNFDSEYSKFKNSRDFLWGYGGGQSVSYFKGTSASYKDIIVDFGFIAVLLYLLSIIGFTMYKVGFKLDSFIYILFFAAFVYQRPYITSMFYAFIIIAPIFVLMKKNKKLNMTNQKFKTNISY